MQAKEKTNETLTRFIIRQFSDTWLISIKNTPTFFWVTKRCATAQNTNSPSNKPSIPSIHLSLQTKEPTSQPTSHPSNHSLIQSLVCGTVTRGNPQYDLQLSNAPATTTTGIFRNYVKKWQKCNFGGTKERGEEKGINENKQKW